MQLTLQNLNLFLKRKALNDRIRKLYEVVLCFGLTLWCLWSVFRAVLGRVLQLLAGVPGVMSHDIWQHCSLLSGCGLVPQQTRGPGSSSTGTHTYTLTLGPLLSFTDGHAIQNKTCNCVTHVHKELRTYSLTSLLVM